jgi:hypothetical protein
VKSPSRKSPSPRLNPPSRSKIDKSIPRTNSANVCEGFTLLSSIFSSPSAPHPLRVLQYEDDQMR